MGEKGFLRPPREGVAESTWMRADTGKAQASAPYLFFYYIGSSLAGSIGAWFFTLGAWRGEAAFIGALSGLALLIALKLARVPSPAHMRAP